MKNKQPTRLRLSLKEQNGLISLIVLVVLLFIAWQLFRQLPPKVDRVDSQAFQAAWIAFKKAQTGATGPNERSAPSKARLQEFDPNLADKPTLLKLGLPARTVNILLNYRKHGGRFRTKEDLKKIYTLTEADYTKLAPYIRIRTAQEAASALPVIETPDFIDLNTVTARELSQLPGIDYKLAKRLLEFRDYLGGFYAVQQIRELYGFPDPVFLKIEDRLKVSDAHLRKIDLNKASSRQLENHPYITRKMAKMIYGLKNSLGHIDSIEQIKQLTLINDENYRKIAPYLKTD